MKFTKILILIHALSMLLVSCGGVGDGTVTTKPDDSTVNPPEPSDAHEYIKYGDELIDLFGFEGMGLYILEPIWYYPSDSVSHMKEAYSSGKNAFIIQFTATDYAEATEVPDYGDLPETKISGTVDKIYAAGEQCSFNEGDVIDLVSHYGFVKTDDGELSLMGYTEFTVIFRKGYSYIVAGLYLDGKYEASPDTFELSSHEDHKAFYNKIGIFEEDERFGKWAFEHRKYRLDEVLRNFPPVDPTKPDVTVPQPDFESPYVDGRWIPDSIADYFDSEIERRPSNSDIEKIKSDMKISEVIELLGKPHRSYDHFELVWITVEDSIFGIKFGNWDSKGEYSFALHNFMNFASVSSVFDRTDKASDGINDPVFKILVDPDSLLPGWVSEGSGDSQFVKYKEELYDVSLFKSFKEARLIESTPNRDPEDIIKKSTDGPDEFVIQFTPTDVAELYNLDDVGAWATVLGEIRGTVDKIYYAGESTDLAEGKEIILGIDYGIGEHSKGAEGQDNLYISVANYDVTLFRNGYSYIVFGSYNNSDIPHVTNKLEISRIEDKAGFFGTLNYEDNWISLGFVANSFRCATDYAYIFNYILTQFPPVEPTKLEN